MAELAERISTEREARETEASFIDAAGETLQSGSPSSSATLRRWPARPAPASRRRRTFIAASNVCAKKSQSCDPLLVGRRNELIDGGTRYEAAKQLGLARVSCVRIDHLSLDDELARVIA
jgi:hypothetical protein